MYTKIMCSFNFYPPLSSRLRIVLNSQNKIILFEFKFNFLFSYYVKDKLRKKIWLLVYKVGINFIMKKEKWALI